MTLVPALFLLLAEAGLRLAGCGHSTAFFQPAVIGGRACLVDNDQFGLRFFPPALARIPAPVVLPAAKAPGAIRIFVFGESAALGDPRPHFGASRYLGALLRERYPGQEFEVVNTAMTAINSHVILPQARECAGLQGDLWVIYMGNNEMVGPFGAATVFGRKAPPLWLVRTTLALQRTRICQLLLDAGRMFEGRGQTAWRGLGLFMENKVPPGDPRRAVVGRNFARNLEDILLAGLGGGAKVVLSTVAVNLKDCPPFATEATNLPAADGLARFDGFCRAAAEAGRAGDWAGARRAYEQAATLGPNAAELLYRLGQSCLHLGDAAAARGYLQRSLDADALPFRADSGLNTTIRETGARWAGRGVVLCDAAARLDAASPAGISGEEFFYEHVHLNFDGNYRLARAWAESLAPLLPPALATRAAAGWAPQETCERRLGLTDWNRLSVYEEVARRLTTPPFNNQPDNAERLGKVQAQIAAVRARTDAGGAEAARAVYVAALRAAPEDFQLHEAFAEFLADNHDFPAAIAERRRVCDLIPHYYFPFFSLGSLLRDAGDLTGALASFQKAADLAPRSGDNRFEIGTVLARQMKWTEALHEFGEARRLGYDDPRLRLYVAEVLWKLNRGAESQAELRELLRVRPGYWEAHYRLGDELAGSGDSAGAAVEFEQVVRLNPKHLKARVNLGVALVNLGRPGEALRWFDEALKLDPANAAALDFKHKVERQMHQR